MTRTDREYLKVRILRLADLKSTGTPAEMAFRFGVSKRTVKRIISELREEGRSITYCQVRGTYIIEKDFY